MKTKRRKTIETDAGRQGLAVLFLEWLAAFSLQPLLPARKLERSPQHTSSVEAMREDWVRIGQDFAIAIEHLNEETKAKTASPVRGGAKSAQRTEQFTSAPAT